MPADHIDPTLGWGLAVILWLTWTAIATRPWRRTADKLAPTHAPEPRPMTMPNPRPVTTPAPSATRTTGSTL